MRGRVIVKLRGKIEKNLDLAERLASQTAVNDLECQLEVNKTITVVREFLDCQDTEHYRALEGRWIPSWRAYKQDGTLDLSGEKLSANQVLHAAWLTLEGTIFLYGERTGNGCGERYILKAEEELLALDQVIKSRQHACA